jgi:hypothetical protein
MEKNETLIIPIIVGYSIEQVLFTIEELSQKTLDDSLRIMLYRKFGMDTQRADELIEKVKINKGLLPNVEISQKRIETTQIIDKILFVQDIKASILLREQLESKNEEQSSQNSFNIVLGSLILGVGLVVTFSGSGVIAFGAIIVGAMRIIRGMSSDC